MIMAD